MAIFPDGVVQFTKKRNLLDDVNADDINKIQDEVVAIETSLKDMGGSLKKPSPLGDGTGGTTQDSQFDSTWLSNFKSLSERLTAIEYGMHIPYVSAEINNAGSTVPSKWNWNNGWYYDVRNNGGVVIPDVVPVTPSTQTPWTSKMTGANGSIVIPRSGFYNLSASMLYGVLGSYGSYDIAISSSESTDLTINNTSSLWTKTYSVSQYYPYYYYYYYYYGQMRSIGVRTSYSGYFKAGTSLWLRSNAYSYTNQYIYNGRLTAQWVAG